jgi:uncharacterized DUF497 family protein
LSLAIVKRRLVARSSIFVIKSGIGTIVLPGQQERSSMRITEIIWIDSIEAKLHVKHHLSVEEVEYVLKGHQQARFISEGNVDGEDVYAVTGRTAAGRYVIVFFILKKGGRVLPISARDMDSKERKLYGKTHS